jgi:hypothetical protein
MSAPSRRVVLVSAGSLGLGWLLGQAWGHRPVAGPDGASLSQAALATLTAALEVFLPEGAPVSQIAADIDTFLAHSDPVMVEDLSVALLVLEHSGGAGPLSFSRFSRLSLPQRAEVLARWQRSSLLTRRRIADALRRTAVFTWYARPESWPSIGYDGPWVSR